jgi:hypothetical protein
MEPTNPRIIKHNSLRDKIHEAMCQIPLKDMYDRIAQLPGIKVVDSSFHYEGEYCQWFVFKDEPWWNINDKRMALELEGNAYNFLLSKGFRDVMNPNVDDVVMYYPEVPAQPVHFGIFKGKDIVVSKFGEGYVYEHPIDAVPLNYGDYYKFLRKVRD